MNRLQGLEAKIAQLYEQKSSNRAVWADWLWDNHVLIAADYARELAQKYGANEELAEAAALLHDVADAVTKRDDPNHEQLSLSMARQLMEEADYSEEEIKLVVDDAIRFHSCMNGERPQTLEGKVLSTADSLAHLKTDFYIYGTWALSREKSLPEIKEWVLTKIERDLNDKILFDDVRQEVKPEYNRIKTLFSRVK